MRVCYFKREKRGEREESTGEEGEWENRKVRKLLKREEHEIEI